VDNEFKDEIMGSAFRVVHCAGARKSFEQALKRIPVRGYCWRSERCENTWFISHYVYKDYQKLKARDTERLGKNWLRIEVNGDER